MKFSSIALTYALFFHQQQVAAHLCGIASTASLDQNDDAPGQGRVTEEEQHTNDHQLNLSTPITGTKSVFMVRVVATNGGALSNKAALSEATLGSGTANPSLSSQHKFGITKGI